MKARRARVSASCHQASGPSATAMAGTAAEGAIGDVGVMLPGILLAPAGFRPIHDAEPAAGARTVLGSRHSPFTTGGSRCTADRCPR